MAWDVILYMIFTELSQTHLLWRGMHHHWNHISHYFDVYWYQGQMEMHHSTSMTSSSCTRNKLSYYDECMKHGYAAIMLQQHSFKSCFAGTGTRQRKPCRTIPNHTNHPMPDWYKAKADRTVCWHQNQSNQKPNLMFSQMNELTCHINRSTKEPQHG